MAENLRKKLKTSSETLHKHKRSIEEAVKRIDSFKFCFVKLLSCNGDFSSSFSNVWCESVRNIEQTHPESSKSAKFDELFDTSILLRVLNEPGMDLNDTQRTAFQRLGFFFENLEDVSEILLERISKNISEADLAGLIGTHLLKQLAVDQQMTISDSGYSTKKGFCCCKSTSCKGMLRYGDTSIGHPEVWHGSVDIILGSVAIDIIDDIEEVEEVNPEMEAPTNNFEDHRDQVIAETIVNGFVQKRGSVPLIAITKDQMKLYVYNPEHDLLYESMECDMFMELKEKKTLRHSVVLLLWFALNFQVFSKGVGPSRLKNAYTSEFKTLMKKRDDVLYKYENELSFGGCKEAMVCKPTYFWFEYAQ